MPSTNASVTGIAVLNDKLYVSRWGFYHVVIYCSTTFQQQGSFSFSAAVCGYEDGYDSEYEDEDGYDYEYECRFVRKMCNMTACDINNCLCASDQQSNRIYKADCQNNYTSSQWSVGANPQGLSVTSSHNLLVALREGHSLREYSTDGDLIREILLQPAGITSPVHAVQLSQDRYAVTHHGPKHQFSIVDSDGKLVQSYGDDAGNLNNPCGIAVDKRGRVLVADQSNNRILVFCSKTLKAYPLPLPDCELNGPYSLHYDSANDRLYIGEWNGGRIICCKLWRHPSDLKSLIRYFVVSVYE